MIDYIAVDKELIKDMLDAKALCCVTEDKDQR